jgi:hypothetical protein
VIGDIEVSSFEDDISLAFRDSFSEGIEIFRAVESDEEIIFFEGRSTLSV